MFKPVVSANVSNLDYPHTFLFNVHRDIENLRNNFMHLCFHLYEAQKCKYYEDLGYKDIYELAESEFDLSKSFVSRAIRVCTSFSRDKNSMFIDVKFKDYNFSQLCEMITLDDVRLKKCKPEMTVRQIRDLKKDKKTEFSKALNLAALNVPGVAADDPEAFTSVATSQLTTDVVEDDHQITIDELPFLDEDEQLFTETGPELVFSDPKVHNLSRVFGNDTERTEFLDTSNAWRLWLDYLLTGQRFYRLDVKDGYIAAEWIFCKHYDFVKKKEVSDWQFKQFYFVVDDKDFQDCKVTKTELVIYLRQNYKRVR